ncbi:hypothetical protein C789_961 [Microcystis aeruginosa FACHB-905 = DIANCHI905]|uniref:Uncharacterized protein n=1 Tax=Microcystis aeruginosa PCC 7806SL TaxID=1903187 RepID=A0AB33BUF9_MICA7|nr:hypothetical protein BH695_3766 [Microcystis aeruginosa PCC 7806SL]ELS49250.1 hypothetical protein C789_961 [Microcystis aeruginosa FACHB-905 = DIANCHI905]
METYLTNLYSVTVSKTLYSLEKLIEWKPAKFSGNLNLGFLALYSLEKLIEWKQNLPNSFFTYS